MRDLKSKIFYLCDRKGHCKFPCYERCKYTTKLEYAKNYKEKPSLVELLNHKIFECIEDNNEGVQFWEIERSEN